MNSVARLRIAEALAGYRAGVPVNESGE